jgi:hypothetical protein
MVSLSTDIPRHRKGWNNTIRLTRALAVLQSSVTESCTSLSKTIHGEHSPRCQQRDLAAASAVEPVERRNQPRKSAPNKVAKAPVTINKKTPTTINKKTSGYTKEHSLGREVQRSQRRPEAFQYLGHKRETLRSSRLLQQNHLGESPRRWKIISGGINTPRDDSIIRQDQTVPGQSCAQGHRRYPQAVLDGGANVCGHWSRNQETLFLIKKMLLDLK